MKFAHPLWLLGTLFALAIGGLLVLGALHGVRYLRRFGDQALVESLLTARVGSRRAVKAVLSVLGLATCFVALAQPQYGWGTRRIPATNLDVIVVLDYSKSMYARDVAPNRIERAKSEVAQLIAQLPGARFGAVAFAGEPLSFPLTSDGGAIAQFFRQLTPHDMPVGGTAIARALEAGRALLERDPQSSKHRRVMLLVTDGEDLEGDPVESARSAHAAGITISVVQIGGRTPEPVPDIDEQGMDRGLRRNDRGELMTTSLSAEGEKQLTQIAETTGGYVVRSEAGSTGIDEVTRRLRAMMTEELSERVETVYADVYAYPLALGLLLLALEAFIPEVRRRRSHRGKPDEVPTSTPEGEALSARARRALIASLLGGFVLGCESPAVDRLFTRHSPTVDDAIAALEEHDAGAAHEMLARYLGTGPCQNGNIGASAALADRPQASFDLGLALFRIGERFGGRFGEDPGRGKEDPSQLAQRSAEVSCALSVVQQIASRHNLPLELRARAHYLLGNLEFLRHEYKAAVSGYDRALALIPGDDDPAASAVGRDAAHNRAIALRLAKEDEQERPDAGPPPGDAGSPPEDQPPSDAGKQDSPDDENHKQQDQQQKPEGDQKQDPQEPPKPQDQQGKDQQPPPSDQQGKQPEQAPQQSEHGEQNEQQAQPPQNLSLSQDDKTLDQLERAPTVQQEAARAQRGRVRRAVEDK